MQLLGKITILSLVVLSLAWLLLGQPAYAASPEQEGDPAALVANGDALLWETKFSEAEAVYNAAIALDPNYASAYAHRCSKAALKI